MELNSVLSSPARVGLPPIRLKIASDERLARLVARGDETAFSVIYDRYHQALYRYCRSLVRHDADAHDALQSALASAFSALSLGRRDAPLRPWLFRIAHNESISLLRRRRPQDELPELAAGDTSLEEHVENKERLALLVADLRELPERQRGALVMREMSGLSHEEIAQALDTSVNAAKQSIFEARRSLAEFEEGRAMACEDICRLVSDADGRMLRSRRIRAHLRHCSACSAFAAAIPERTLELRALAPPLPAFAAASILARALGGGSVHGGEGAGLLAAGAGKAAGTAVATKLTAVAVAATTTVGVAVALRQRMHPHAAHRHAPAARIYRGASRRKHAAVGYSGTNGVTGAGASQSSVSADSIATGRALSGAAARHRAGAAGLASAWSTSSVAGTAPAHGRGKHHATASGTSATGSAGGATSSSTAHRTAKHAAGASSKTVRTGSGKRPARSTRHTTRNRGTSGVTGHRLRRPSPPPPPDPTISPSSMPLRAAASMSQSN